MPPDSVDDFIALPQDRQMALLKGLPQANQDALLAQVKQRKSAAPTTQPDWRDKFSEIQAPDPNDRWNPKEAVKAIGNIGAGGLGMLLHPINTMAGIGGMVTAPFEMATGTPFSQTVPGQMVQGFKQNPLGTIEAGIGQAGAAGGIGEVAKGVVPPLAKAGANIISAGGAGKGPVNVPVAGVDVPMLKGEVSPEGSELANTTENLKRRATPKTAEKFNNFQANSENAARDAMRQAAFKAVPDVGTPTDTFAPSTAETPRGMVLDSALETQARGKALYQDLDASLTKVPTDFSKVADLTRKAYAKARSYGAPLSSQFSPNEPLQGVQAVRSELLRVARTTADPKIAGAAFDEAQKLTSDITTSLESSSDKTLLPKWNQANMLWTKYHAMQDVASALDSATSGAPSGSQGIGVSPRAPALKGSSMVEILNKLNRNRMGRPVPEGKGDLTAALGPEQAKAFITVADLLDRSQQTTIGKGETPHVTPFGAVARGVGGAKGPLIGGGLGLAVGGFHGMEAGAAVGFLVQQLGKKAFVNAMTGEGFAHAINKLAESKSAPDVAKWTATALAAGPRAQNQQNPSPAANAQQ